MGELDGRAFGSYEIIRELGHGGMAIVYLGRQTNMDRLVAIKVIAALYSTEADFRARFDQEARTIARLEHPHILPVIDYGEEDFGAFLVMRYVDGGTLEARLKTGPLAFDEAYDMLGKVAFALDYAHSRGVVHRDLKPANILLDSTSNPYLTDFGIAKILQNTTQLTRTGAAVGTPAYMAPEQWKSEPVGPYTDQYALGVVLYEMITGDLPFKADTTFGYMHKHIYERPEPPSLILSDLPQAAGDVILRALAKEPEGRFPSLRALYEAFGMALYDEYGAPTRPAGGEDATALNATAVDPTGSAKLFTSTPSTARRVRTPTPRPPLPAAPDDDETAALPVSDPALEPPTPADGRRGWLVIAAVAVVTVLVLAAIVAGGAALLGGGPTPTLTPTEPIMVAAFPTETDSATATDRPTATETEAEATQISAPLVGSTATPTAVATASPAPTETPTATVSPTPSRTAPPSETPTPDVVETQAAALVATSQQVARDLTATRSALIVSLATGQAAQTGTAIAVASFTATPAPSPTITLTPSLIPTVTPPPTRTPLGSTAFLPTITPRPFASVTPRPSLTPVISPTPLIVSCSGLLPSRIAPGMRAIVSANDPRPVNVREEPGLTATRIGQLLVATQFMVLEGPTCKDGYPWFQVRRIGGDGVTGWIAESGEGVYYVDPLEGTTSAQACPGVMIPRLTIGTSATVDTPTNEPLRLRNAAGETGRVIGLVPEGTRLTVLDGPRCADAASWWQVRLPDGRTGWASEADADSYFITP